MHTIEWNWNDSVNWPIFFFFFQYAYHFVQSMANCLATHCYNCCWWCKCSNQSDNIRKYLNWPNREDVKCIHLANMHKYWWIMLKTFWIFALQYQFETNIRNGHYNQHAMRWQQSWTNQICERKEDKNTKKKKKEKEKKATMIWNLGYHLKIEHAL